MTEWKRPHPSPTLVSTYSALGPFSLGRQEEQQPLNPNPNLNDGDVVVVKEVDAHRNNYPLGRIKKPIWSDDGLVRKARVETEIKNNESFYDILNKQGPMAWPLGEECAE